MPSPKRKNRKMPSLFVWIVWIACLLSVMMKNYFSKYIFCVSQRNGHIEVLNTKGLYKKANYPFNRETNHFSPHQKVVLCSSLEFNISVQTPSSLRNALMLPVWFSQVLQQQTRHINSSCQLCQFFTNSSMRHHVQELNHQTSYRANTGTTTKMSSSKSSPIELFKCLTFTFLILFWFLWSVLWWKPMKTLNQSHARSPSMLHRNAAGLW